MICIFTNNDWDSLTRLEINIGLVNENEELYGCQAILKYSDYEVIGFSANWVSLRVSD